MPDLPFSRFLLVVAALAAAGAVHAENPADPLPRPLTREAALTYALAHNPDLRRVEQQVAEREGVRLEATAARKPSIHGTGAYGYTQERLFEALPGFPDMPLPDANAWAVEISVRQLVYSGGATAARERGAQERIEAARGMLTTAVNRTVLAVEESFLGVLLAREQIQVHQEALQVLERESEQAKVRRGAGTGSDFEVLRAEVAVANARPALIRAQNAYRGQQDALRTALGAEADLTEGPETDLAVVGDLVVPHFTVNLADAVRSAREHRPELLAGDRSIAAAHEDIAYAKAGQRPQVSVVGGYEYKKAAYSARWGDTLNGFTVGTQVDWPIFDGAATKARVKQATAREAQVVAAKDDLRLHIDLEVRDAHRALGEASDLLASAEKVIGEASESLRLAQARVTAGTATQLDVLAAQSALTEARSNLSQANHDYALSAARLRWAMGASSRTAE